MRRGLILFAATAWAAVHAGLWAVLESSGTVHGFEHFIVTTGYKSFRFVPRELFSAVLKIGLIIALTATGFTVLMAVLFNQVSAFVGGIKLTTADREP